MKICVIGNSHTTAIKLAWSEIETDYPDVDFTFFSAPANDMADLYLSNEKLLTNNVRAQKYMRITSGLSHIEINKYDAFVLSLSAGPKKLLGFFKRHRTLNLMRASENLISDNLLSEGLKDSFQNQPAFNILRLLRSQTNKPAVIVQTPMPTRLISSSSPLWAEVDELFPILSSHIASHVPTLEKELRFTYLSQPENTFDGGYSQHTYSVGSKKLRGAHEHEIDEPHHMNQSYGLIVIKDILRTLRG